MRVNPPQDGPHDAVDGPPPLQPYRPGGELDPDLRKRARERIEERNAFRIHLVTYLAVMTMLTGIWLVTGGVSTLFWPVFPMLGWGVGVVIHGASVLIEREPSEEQIAQEAARLRRRRGEHELHD